MASVPAFGGRAFLSSGTWSLLGTEVPAPIITPRTLEANFTNEGGVCGTTRLLKNIGGLLAAAVVPPRLGARGPELRLRRADGRRGRRAGTRSVSLFDPDDPVVPPSARHGARRSATTAGARASPSRRDRRRSRARSSRASRSSTASCWTRSKSSPACRSSRSRSSAADRATGCLNQFTADATGRTVLAGPAEATALGNIAMQMLATGAVGSLAEARRIIEYSFPVDRFEPDSGGSLGRALPPLPGLRGADLCLSLRDPCNRQVSEEPLGRPRSRQTDLTARPAALPLEPARRGSPHHQFRRRQHELEVRAAGSADREAVARDGGEGQRRRSAIDRLERLRRAVSRQARGAARPLPRRGARGRDGRLLSAVRVRREPRRGVDRHGAARVPAVSARRSPASRLGDRARGERQRRGEARGVQPQVRAQHRLGALAASRASSSR